MAQQVGGIVSPVSVGRALRCGVVAGIVFSMLLAGTAWAQRPSTDRHVPELASLSRPRADRRAGRVPATGRLSDPLGGRGQAPRPLADARRGHLPRRAGDYARKGGGSVPSVIVENRSRDEYVFITTGEVIAGGMQTRTVRHDVILAPGQRIDLDVFCVEAHRWAGGKDFGSGKVLLPQSIQCELRKGADQGRIWSEVARNKAGA